MPSEPPYGEPEAGEAGGSGTVAVLRACDAQRREFMGVSFELLATGQRSMVTKMLYRADDRVPDHRHPNEQSGYVVSGRYRLTVDRRTSALASGDSYSIPAGAEHRMEVDEPGVVIDVFTPPRDDYR